MILIDETYFTGELSLPNIPVTISDEAEKGVALAIQTVGENNLDVFVDKYVIDYLILLFGRELTSKFLNEINTGTPNEIWINLKNQLLVEAGKYKASPLANYAYYWLMRDARTKTTMTGEADGNFDNAENVNNQYKLVRAWNDMVDMTFTIYNWFCKNCTDYEEYIGCHTGRKICSLTQSINTFGI